MLLKSYGGHSFGTDYEVWISDGSGRGLPGVQGQLVGRLGAWPLLSGIGRPGHRFTLMIHVDAGDVDALLIQLRQWFDPESETPAALVATDDDGYSNERYRMCLCEALQPLPDGGGFAERVFVATMVVNGDVRWRAVTPDSETWDITASGQTTTISNGGEDKAYPILTITPTAATSGYQYRRFVPITWRAMAGASKYPVQIGGLDTDALVTASKMQADGDDLRVEVDGVEVDRWLVNMNTADTDIWINLDFSAAVSLTLAVDIAAAGEITSIVANEDISALGSSGILKIENEVFSYTAKDNPSKTFSGITRATRGTAEAGHAATTAISWLQHDVWLLYGDASAAAPTVDDNYKPVFTLASSDNGTWDYDEFGETDGLRSGSWTHVLYQLATFYTANHFTNANPWQEMGVRNYGWPLNEGGSWRIYNPCFITNANFQNGEYYDTASYAIHYIESSLNGSTWTVEYTIPYAVTGAWTAWSRDQAITANSPYVRLNLYQVLVNASEVEVADVTLTLNASYIPVVAIGAEQTDAYVLAATITNNTTVEAISLNYTMLIDDSLEVDTDAKTVTDLTDDGKQQQAITIVDGPRRQWLALEPGDNVLAYVETGVTGVTITIEFEKRYYS